MDKQELRKWAVEQVLEHMLYLGNDIVDGPNLVNRLESIITAADKLCAFVNEGI